MNRLTKETIGCFKYTLKDHKPIVGEFGTYDAFFDYSMAVKKLGEYEDTGLEPEDILSNIKTLSNELNNALEKLAEYDNPELLQD